MSFKQVLAPAIKVAQDGFRLNDNFVGLVKENEKKFALFPETAARYMKDGKPLPAGTLLRNPDLAKTYRLLSTGGVKAFYSGKLAQAIVDAVNRPPVAAGVAVRAGSMPLPSSGGVAIAEALNILEGFDLKSMPREKAEHLYMEAARLAFADRNAYLADPEFVDAPVAGLLSKQYAARRRELIDPAQARHHAQPGDPYLFQQDPSVPLRPSGAAKSKLLSESAHTTHLAVSDKEGNIVAYTFTIESWGGSGITVPGYGFILNNEMTDFDFTGPHPNVPEAGKRPRSSMSPTIAFRNGKPAFTVGSPGGATIVTTVLQTIFNHIDLGMDMPAALNAPRISERNGQATSIEPGFAGSPQARALERFGQRWDPAAEEIGAANAIVFNADGTVTAVSEGKRHGVGSALVQKRGH
jgi:gamma-glutamyltranspeptidase/glutathione hydrolase